jgi:hypothetical protein
MVVVLYADFTVFAMLCQLVHRQLALMTEMSILYPLACITHSLRFICLSSYDTRFFQICMLIFAAAVFCILLVFSCLLLFKNPIDELLRNSWILEDSSEKHHHVSTNAKVGQIYRLANNRVYHAPHEAEVSEHTCCEHKYTQCERP